MKHRLNPIWLLALLSLALAVPASAQEEGEGDDSGEETTVEEEAPAPAPAPEADPEISIYRELKTVESSVDDLKERVFRSKARLLLLEEKVIRGVVSGAKGVFRHVNNLGPAYRLETITYYFDGNPIFEKKDLGAKTKATKNRKEQIFEANIPPGNHTLSVSGIVRGNGQGLFAYLGDYTLQFSASYSFIAKDGKTSRIDAVLQRKGGAMAEFEDIEIDFKILGGKSEKQEQSTGAKPAGETGSGS
jgi:hypothetical protein